MEAMEGDVERVASPESLLEWVNTFSVLETKCQSFEELSSGEVLLKCLCSVIPGVTEDDMHKGSRSTDSWTEIWSMLEEFYKSSLTKVISLEEVLSGNEEHIARVVVLLLCAAVQKSPNEDVIRGITSLNELDQWNIMFFIESALAKVKSSAITTGTFTSGIGERLPTYETQTLAVSVESLSQPSTPAPITTGGCDSSFVEQQPGSVYKSTPQNSRMKSVKKFGGALFYEGLDSPAGAFWLKSPAITRSVSKSSLATCSTTAAAVSNRMVEDSVENKRETCVLEHRIRVLQRAVDNQASHVKVLQRKLDDQGNLLTDCSSQLESKTEEYLSLESEHLKLLDKLQHVEEVKDLRDELDQRNEDLKKAEKSLTRFQSEVDVLQGYKKRAVELEGKMEYYEHVEAQAEESKQALEQAMASLVELSGTSKRLELELKTTTIELQAKSSELDHLLERNREFTRELKEWESRCKQLQETKASLQCSLEEKTDVEQTLIREKNELTVKIENLQGVVSNHQVEVDALSASKKSVEQQHQAALAEHMEYNSQVEELIRSIKVENEQLKTKNATLEGNIEAEQCESKVLVTRKDDEITNLKNTLSQKAAEFRKYKEESEAYIVSLDHEKQLLISDVTAKDTILVELTTEITSLKEKLSSIERSLDDQRELLTSKESLLSSLSADRSSLEDQVEQLTSDLQAQSELCGDSQAALLVAQSQLTTKEDAVSTLQGEVSTLEIQLADCREMLTCKEEENSTLQAQHEEALRNLAAVEQELTESRNGVLSTNDTVSLLTSEKSTLEEQLASLQTDVSNLQERIATNREECQQQLATKDETILSLASEKSSLEREVESLHNHSRDISQKQVALQQELADQSAKLASKEDDLSSLLSEKASLESQLNEIQSQLRAQIEALTTSLSERENEFASNTDTISSLTRERDALTEKVECIEIQYRTKCETDEATVALTQQRATDLQNRVAAFEKELEDMTQSRNDIKTSFDQSQVALAALQREADEAKEAFKEKRIVMEEQQERLKQQLQSTTNQMKKSEERYQEMADELEGKQEEYTSQLESLREKNKQMTAQQEELYKQLRDDNHSILQKQNRLYEQLDEMRKREQEAISLTQDYEAALKKEQARSQSMRVRIEDLEGELEASEDLDTAVDQLKQELNLAHKKLAKEERRTSKLVAENKSLETQLSFASHKLRDIEKTKARVPSSPPPSSRPITRGYEPRSSHEDEFYTQIQSEFNSKTGRGLRSSIPFEIDGESTTESSGEENEVGDDSLRVSMLSRPTTASSSRSSKFGTSSTTQPASVVRGKNKGDRINELQRRNALALPHLKTSYPIETQVQPESLEATNEKIKNGRPKKKASRKISNSLEKPPKQTSTAFEISLDTIPESKPVRNPRKRPKERRVAERRYDDSEDDFPRSPLPTRRRISAPPTPGPQDDILAPSKTSLVKELRRNTMAPSSFKLREFLNERDVKVQPASRKQQQAGSAVAEQAAIGTTFTIDFSPPKSKAPKRLQENKPKTVKGSNVGDDSVRRATIVKKKKRSPATTGTVASRRKAALKSRN